jgi:GNAT superfamily N-acetyltransferase
VETLIRPFGDDDAAAVVELSLRAWQPVFESLEAVLGTMIFDRLHPDWRADQRRAVGAVLASETINVWVAQVVERVGGFVAVELHPERGIGEVYMLAVDPAVQNDGIGSGLTAFALNWISEAGMTVAMVESGGDPGHAPARRTYEKAGFSLLPVARYFKAL